MIELHVNETATRLLQQAWQTDVLRGLRETMDRENQLTIGEIRRHNRGQGPFPVSENRLGVKTRRWSGSINSPSARIAGTVVLSSIGSNVEYAAAHEFGFRGQVNVRQQIRRQRSRNVSKSGRLGVRDKSATAFGIAPVKAYTRQMDIPARAPITTGIEKHKPKYEAAMSKSIIDTLRGLGYR